MASSSVTVIDGPATIDVTAGDRLSKLAQDLYKSVKKDHLVKAKFILKGLSKDEKKRIVSHTFDGNTPLFIAAQQGQVHFVNYLLEECYADIEQKGVYEVAEDRSKHQVTPLWCSSVANKVEVVKALLRHGADVNATSDTNSTPVRSACYMTNIEVVKVLVDHGADIHKPNVNGGTCLINSVQSTELCSFLIDKGATVNAQDNSGNLALHYAIREGRIDTVKLLLRHHSDPFVKNDFGDDAIQSASLRGYSEILEYLIQEVNPSVERQIEAYELMGTNYVDEKHDIQLAISTWRTAMNMRYADPNNIIRKSAVLNPNPAYMGVAEAGTREELEEAATNPDVVYMQALLIRERLLGPDHKDTVFGLMYRGAVYADTHRYQRCVDLWKYAFKLRHDKQEPLNHECIFTLQALCKLFWEIHEEYAAGYTTENVRFADVCEVLDMAIEEIVNKKDDPAQEGGAVSVFDTSLSITGEETHIMLLLILHLIHLHCKIITEVDQREHLCMNVHQLIHSGMHGNNGKTLLHLAADKKISTVQEEFYSNFPNLDVIRLLIKCGSDVNSLDSDRNTVLHVCGEGLGLLLTQQKYRETLGEIVILLLECGAHIDCVNNRGINVGMMLQNRVPNVHVIDYISLKCLAARVIKKCNIQYEGEIPGSLIPFIDLH